MLQKFTLSTAKHTHTPHNYFMLVIAKRQFYRILTTFSFGLSDCLFKVKHTTGWASESESQSVMEQIFFASQMTLLSPNQQQTASKH